MTLVPALYYGGHAAAAQDTPIVLVLDTLLRGGGGGGTRAFFTLDPDRTSQTLRSGPWSEEKNLISQFCPFF